MSNCIGAKYLSTALILGAIALAFVQAARAPDIDDDLESLLTELRLA